MVKKSVPNSQRIFWVDLNRFDLKPDKSTWLEISRALGSRGYDVSILTGYATSKYRPEANKANIIYFRALNVPGLFRYSLLVNILTWLLLYSRQSDIVILPPGGLYLAPCLRLFRRKNLYLDVRTVPIEINMLRMKIDSLLFWKMPMRYFQKYVAGYSFITDRLRKAVEQEFAVQFDDYVIWQSGVNTKRFQPVNSATSMRKRNDFLLFYHGTITRNRGIDRVLEAMVQLSGRYRANIRFVIVGTGSGYGPLAQFAFKQKISRRVTFKGLLPYEKIPKEISKADCCICPLPDRPEWNVSSPIKIFEYMACGKPMILTPMPAHKDIIQDNEFVVWTTGYEAEHFRSAIEWAYDNRASLVDASRKAPSLVKNKYEWDIQGQKLADYISHIFETQ